MRVVNVQFITQPRSRSILQYINLTDLFHTIKDMIINIKYLNKLEKCNKLKDKKTYITRQSIKWLCLQNKYSLNVKLTSSYIMKGFYNAGI